MCYEMMVEVKDNISSQTKDAKTRNKSDPDPDQGFSDYRITWGSSLPTLFPHNSLLLKATG
jgi:hypothetical protein